MQAVRGITDESIDLEYAYTHAVAVGDETEKVLALVGHEMKSLLSNFPTYDISRISVGASNA